MHKEEYLKMTAGEMYDPKDPYLKSIRKRSLQLGQQFNSELDDSIRSGLVKELFGSTGETLGVNAPFIAEYGINVHVGDHFFCNFGSIFLDICPITIGNNCMFGPNTQLYTASHPLDPTERNSGVEFGKPITIGDNAWFGGGVIVCPGVTLGNNVVVGAGSVVTKSFGDNVVLAGNPAVVIKTIDSI